MRNKLISFFLFLILLTPLFAQTNSAKKPLNQITFEDLSLQDQIAQTIFIATDIDTAYKYKNAIEKGLVGGVLIQWGNYSLEETKTLIDKMQSWAKKSPLGLPLLIAIDYEGGTVYTPVTLGFPYLPTNMLLAAANNPMDTTTLFYIVATELKNAGVNINFSPVIDVNINPSNPIIGVRSFGSDTKIVSDMGLALITGMQKAGVMAVAKHFPGHGETALDSHYATPHFNQNEKTFRTIHLPPFQEAIKGGVMGIMSAHIIYDFLDNKNPATFSPTIINKLLKEELGFKGIIISDSLDMQGASKTGDITNAAIKSLASGVDIVLTSRQNPAITNSELLKQINKTLPKTRVSQAAQKVFELKKNLGLFEENKPTMPIKSSLEAYNYFAQKLSNQGVSLIRTDNNFIPFKPNTEKPQLCTILFSPSRFADQLTDFSAPFTQKGWKVKYYNASMNPQAKDIARAKDCMKEADLVVVGSLQWADRPLLSQKIAIKQLAKINPDIVLLSLMSPYDIKNYPQIKNVIAMFGISKFSSKAAANIILGNIEAKGKSPVNLN
ncbi:MAG: glycoside hydrolase family 3 protein [Elusimicrobiaceae bacterium]|nr:glycoside hydrolase family 3 protein [Elusimicrobiaceae bacterium]